VVPIKKHTNNTKEYFLKKRQKTKDKLDIINIINHLIEVFEVFILLKNIILVKASPTATESKDFIIKILSNFIYCKEYTKKTEKDFATKHVRKKNINILLSYFIFSLKIASFFYVIFEKLIYITIKNK
jgi:hypothetical protein